MAGTGGIEREYVPLSSGPSGAGAAVSIVIPLRSGARIQIGFLHSSYTAAPAGGRITLADADVPKLDLDVIAGGPQVYGLPGDGITFNPGAAVTATLASGGGAIIGKISLGYRYVYDR